MILVQQKEQQKLVKLQILAIMRERNPIIVNVILMEVEIGVNGVIGVLALLDINNMIKKFLIFLYN